MKKPIILRKIPLTPFRKWGIVTTLILIFLTCSKILAGTNYVSLSGGHNFPFDSWENGATNIQDAVCATVDGDEVLVNAGTYVISDEIEITNNITISSISGAEVTKIESDGNENGFRANKKITARGFSFINWLCVKMSG